jgi:translation initiation factor IF-2
VNKLSKKRIYEIAKTLGKPNKEIVEIAHRLGMAVKSHMSSIEEKQINKIVDAFKKKPDKKQNPVTSIKTKPSKKIVATKVSKNTEKIEKVPKKIEKKKD